MKIIEKETFHLRSVLSPFFPIERASNILPGQDDFEKKINMDPWTFFLV